MEIDAPNKPQELLNSPARAEVVYDPKGRCLFGVDHRQVQGVPLRSVQKLQGAPRQRGWSPVYAAARRQLQQPLHRRARRHRTAAECHPIGGRRRQRPHLPASGLVIRRLQHQEDHDAGDDRPDHLRRPLRPRPRLAVDHCGGHLRHPHHDPRLQDPEHPPRQQPLRQ